jgi:MFS family permease
MGSWFAGPVTDKLGRRAGMFFGGLIICIGSAVIASAFNRGQFIAGRFVSACVEINCECLFRHDT